MSKIFVLDFFFFLLKFVFYLIKVKNFESLLSKKKIGKVFTLDQRKKNMLLLVTFVITNFLKLIHKFNSFDEKIKVFSKLMSKSLKGFSFKFNSLFFI